MVSPASGCFYDYHAVQMCRFGGLYSKLTADPVVAWTGTVNNSLIRSFLNQSVRHSRIERPGGRWCSLFGLVYSTRSTNFD